MKVVVCGAERRKIEYPKLRNVITDPDKIILMLTPTTGVVLQQGKGSQRFGVYHIAYDPKLLEDFVGTVTLEN